MKRVLQWMFLAALVITNRVEALEKVNLLLGEQKTLEFPNVSKVAVGDGNVLKVQVVSASELLLTALSPGLTTMTVWGGDGVKETMTVQIYAENPEVILQQIQELLQVDGTPIEGVRARIVGDRVILDGEVLKDSDAKRVDDLVKLYPSAVNLTVFNRSFNLMKPMVQLDFQFYEMRRDNLSEVGIDWSNILDPIDDPLVEFTYDLPVNGPDGSDGSGNVRVFSNFNPVRLRGAAEQTKLLHQHKMVVRNAEKAHYLEGGTVYIIAQSATGSGQIRDVEFGFVVDVTPEVDKAGNIVLAIDQSFSVPDRAQLIAGFPTFNERSIQTSVNLAMGQTVMLSGFLTENVTKQSLGIPGLARLPVLGALFGSQSSGLQNSEGILFITPTLIRGVGTPGEDPFIRGLVDRYRTDAFDTRSPENP